MVVEVSLSRDSNINIETLKLRILARSVRQKKKKNDLKQTGLHIFYVLI